MKLRVYQSRTGLKLAQASLADVISILDKMVVRLGIKDENKPTKPEILELVAYMQMKYGFLHQSEIGIAVELLFDQELKDAAGKVVMPNAYQNFGLQFLAGWMVGYKIFRNKAIADVRKILPEPEPGPENEVERHWLSELETRVAILAAYYEYLDFGRMPEQVIAGTMFQYIEANEWFTVPNAKKMEIWREAPQHLKRRLLGGPNTTKLMDMFNAAQKEIDLNENKFALQTISRAQCLKLCFAHWKNQDTFVQEVMNLHLCGEAIPDQERICYQVESGDEPTGTEGEVLGALYNQSNSGR